MEDIQKVIFFPPPGQTVVCILLFFFCLFIWFCLEAGKEVWVVVLGNALFRVCICRRWKNVGRSGQGKPLSLSA